MPVKNANSEDQSACSKPGLSLLAGSSVQSYQPMFSVFALRDILLHEVNKFFAPWASITDRSDMVTGDWIFAVR